MDSRFKYASVKDKYPPYDCDTSSLQMYEVTCKGHPIGTIERVTRKKPSKYLGNYITESFSDNWQGDASTLEEAFKSVVEGHTDYEQGLVEEQEDLTEQLKENFDEIQRHR